jgi:protein involved in plasmid replication-relaxation
MRLTKRCLDFLHLLAAVRVLTTGQIRRRFFQHASPDAARKWLRKATKEGYLRMYRRDRMTEALFMLGPEGKRVLEREGATEIVLDRKLPKQIEHRLGINDIRIAAEMSLPLRYFFACWELPEAGWHHPVIPDAVFAVGARTYAVEFDRGLENLRFFVRSKIAVYQRGLEGFPLTAVLIVADRKARMQSLARAISGRDSRFLFTTIDLVRKQGLAAPIFHRSADDKAVQLV